MHELRVRDGAPVRRGWSGRHVHELRVQDGEPVGRDWSGQHVHEFSEHPDEIGRWSGDCKRLVLARQ